MKKSTDNTVFVRWLPPSSSITRFHLQDHFSQIGPIRKCSVISGQGKGYGFVKYLSQEDAETAASTLNNVSLEVDEKRYKLTVELATQEQVHPEESLEKKKRTSRVIVRNVSFYAKEGDVRKVLEQEYGPICELTLPRGSDKLHRGFCFVTFSRPQDAQKAVKPRSTPLLIKKRPVAIDFSISKQQHQQEQKAPRRKQKDSSNGDKDDSEDDEINREEDEDDADNDEGESEENEEEHVESESEENEDDDGDKSESEENDDDEEEDDEKSESEESEKDEGVKSESKAATDHDDAVSEHRCLFIRNLPFDVTRHDLFERFSKFGHINSIYLVMDKGTNTPKGTAFVSYRQSEAASRALEAARDSTTSMHIHGRQLFVDLAVDKKTAATMVETKATGKDRRNLYLKLEGRVDGGEKQNSAWEDLPKTDQLKRQRAFAEKNTKLKSPLFYINPKRLSIRNLAKHVNEASLKALCVMAPRRGLERKIVSQEDQVAHWKASGELTTRDIMMRIEQVDSVIPAFDESNVKQFIPSVYIDRDFTTQKGEKAPSRGFGFVDFEHHVHALACLRELNNNPCYTADYVAGGKHAVEQKKVRKRKRKDDVGEFVSEDGRALIPRLIVDFTVSQCFSLFVFDLTF